MISQEITIDMKGYLCCPKRKCVTLLKPNISEKRMFNYDYDPYGNLIWRDTEPTRVDYKFKFNFNKKDKILLEYLYEHRVTFDICIPKKCFLNGCVITEIDNDTIIGDFLHVQKKIPYKQDIEMSFAEGGKKYGKKKKEGFNS